jgi:hypothetical protein
MEKTRERSWIYKFYFDHYFLRRIFLNMAVVRNSEVMLGQLLNCFV